MRNTQTQISFYATAVFIGITLWSLASATTPEESKAQGAAFLAENAKKASVVTTASGLQYQIVKQGKGSSSPSATDNVTVHYKGTTIAGEEFDSSYSRGVPATFPLNQVIKGWTEGVQLMKEGDQFRFFIPPELAYGAHGSGPIGPYQTLIFDVELIRIN